MTVYREFFEMCVFVLVRWYMLVTMWFPWPSFHKFQITVDCCIFKFLRTAYSWCFFRVNPPFSNSSSLLRTGPKSWYSLAMELKTESIITTILVKLKFFSSVKENKENRPATVISYKNRWRGGRGVKVQYRKDGPKFWKEPLRGTMILLWLSSIEATCCIKAKSQELETLERTLNKVQRNQVNSIRMFIGRKRRIKQCRKQHDKIEIRCTCDCCEVEVMIVGVVLATIQHILQERLKINLKNVTTWLQPKMCQQRLQLALARAG